MAISRGRSRNAVARDVPSTYVEPMKALGVESIPRGPYSYEIKFDGYRALAIFGSGAIGLWSRNANELSDKYPEVTAELKKLKLKDTVLDGEIVALDPEGRPRFQLLQGLGKADGRPPLLFYVFDVLRHSGRSYLDQPIEHRREVLAGILPADSPVLRLSPVFDGEPDALLAEVRRQDLEGLVAKELGSRYEAGRRSGTWLKYRLARDQEFVIGGYTPPKGGRHHFGAILVGYHEGKNLLYAGKVGTGFDQTQLGELHRTFDRLATESCPFANLPLTRRPRYGQGMTAAAMREVTWLRPRLVCQIKFSEWTDEGSLRHPVFLGLRKDKAAREVVREIVAVG